jgi:hypothetical protein
MDNLSVWKKYEEVPAEALKPFDNGKFKGTDINTIWRIKCLTEEFGVCGVGWYFKPVKLWTEKLENGEVFAFAEIELFVKVDGEWSMPISGNGGNKLLRVTKDGNCSTSDEAYKMAITDALGVACRNLGFGAKIYWANDKTKYTEDEAKEPKTKYTLIKEKCKKVNVSVKSVEEWVNSKIGKETRLNDLTEEQFKKVMDMLEKQGEK